VTIAKWLTPKGEIIHGKGLEPDVKVEITAEDINNKKDPQLDKALELARKLSE
jgi:carboxyl-terminal processing protease